jgi:hypothetical protein
LKPWPEDARLNLCQEQSHPSALRSQGVAELAADRLDETFTLESAQIVAHLAGGVFGVWHPKQLGHERAEPSVGDPFRREHEQTERSEECRHARIPELEGRGWLTLRGAARGSQCAQLGLAEPAVMGGAFQVEQPPIDAPSQGAEVGEVTQTPSNAKVVRVIEGGLGAQSAPLLEVLLDVTALVLDVQAGQDAVSDDPCREPCSSRARGSQVLATAWTAANGIRGKRLVAPC